MFFNHTVLSSTLELLKKSVVEYLFPLYCLGCNREGVWVCADCFTTIGQAGVHACPVCHAPSVDGSVCGECVSISALQAQRAVGEYREGALLGKLIHVFKYEYAEESGAVLGAVIRPYLVSQRGDFASIDLIVPVPLHPRRRAERGFNQSEPIARLVSETIERPVASALRRGRYTAVQARLGRAERIENVRSAFALEKGVDLAGKKVLLVDDVYTTGSTMQECARVLRAAGAARVTGFTVARG